MSKPILGSERLLRNVHPLHYDNGRFYSAAFNPSQDHDYKLSVDRMVLSSPKASYDRHVGLGLSSIGVCGVFCSDFVTESVSCYEDALPTNAAHALADFSPFSQSDRKKKAREIAKRAEFEFRPG